MDIKDWVLLANSLVLTGLTFFLVKFTRHLWIETKRLRLKETTPQISVYFYPVTGLFLGLCVENTSDIDARNVTITCLNKNMYNNKKGRKFYYNEKLSKNISYIPARQKYSFMVGYFTVMKSEVFEFDITFFNMQDDTPLHRKIFIDVSMLGGIVYEPRPEEKIASSIGKIQKSLDLVIEKDGINRGVRVYPYSVTERRLRNLELDDLARRRLEEYKNERSKD